MKKIQTYFPYLSFYIIFLIPSFFILAWFFTTFIEDYLWYEWDKIPILGILSHPTVHTEHPSYFKTSPFVAYSTWYFFIFAIFLLPIIPTGLIIKEREKLLRRH